MAQYQRYNESFFREQAIEEARKKAKPQVDKAIKDISEKQQEVSKKQNQFRKGLEQATRANQELDIREVSKKQEKFQKQEQKISQAKKKARKPLRELDKEEKKVEKARDRIPTPEELQKKGFKKETRGNKVILYRTDDYERKENDERTYRPDEYVFNKNGKPIKITERELVEERDGDLTPEQYRSVQFDSKGRVQRVEEYDEGKREKGIDYDFSSKGMTIEETDYEAERRQQKTMSLKNQTLSKSSNKNRATQSELDRISKYVGKDTTIGELRDKGYSMDAIGKLGKANQKYRKEKEFQDFLNKQKEPSVVQNLSSVNAAMNDAENKKSSTESYLSNINIETGTPGVNQGTKTKNIGQVKKNNTSQTEITMGPVAPKSNQINLNPGRAVTGPLIFASETIASRGRNVKEGYRGIKKLYKDRGFFQGTQDIVTSTIESSIRDPFGTAGGIITGSYLTKVGRSALRAGKDAYIRTGSRRVDSSDITTDDVISGRETMPTTTSTEQSLRAFRESNNEVSTASPSKIQAREAGRGRKGGVLEDPGIYVTPSDRTSLGFTRVEQPKTVQYSLNPFKGANTKVPTVTTFKTQGVQRQPRGVVAEPGFSQTEEFFRQQSGSGKAYITKRSEIGQGELPRQSFRAKEDYTSDFAMTVQRDGKTIKTKNVQKGDIITESGTSEMEAVIPVTQTFSQKPAQTIAGRVKGFDEYTEFRGRPVAIRRAELDINNPQQATRPSFEDPFKKKPTTTTSKKTVSGRRVQSETRAVSSLNDNVEVRSPTPGAASTLSTPSFNTNSIFRGSDPFSKTRSSGNLSSSPTSPTTPNFGSPFGPTPGKSSSTGGGSGRGRSPLTSRSTINPPSVPTSSSPGIPSMVPPNFGPGNSKRKPDLPKDKDIKDPFGKSSKKTAKSQGQYVGSLTALVQGITTDKATPKKKTTGLSKRSILRGRGF